MHCSHVQHTSPTQRIFIAFGSYEDVFQTIKFKHWEDDIGPSTTMGYPRLSFFNKGCCALNNNSSWKHQKSQTLTLTKKSDRIAWMSLHSAHAIRVKSDVSCLQKTDWDSDCPGSGEWRHSMFTSTIYQRLKRQNLWVELSEKLAKTPKNLPFPSLSKTNFLNFSTSNGMSEVLPMRVHHIISYFPAQDTLFATLSVEHGWTSANTFLLQIWHLLAIDQIDPLSHLLHAPQPRWNAPDWFHRLTYRDQTMKHHTCLATSGFFRST